MSKKYPNEGGMHMVRGVTASINGTAKKGDQNTAAYIMTLPDYVFFRYQLYRCNWLFSV